MITLTPAWGGQIQTQGMELVAVGAALIQIDVQIQSSAVGLVVNSMEECHDCDEFLIGKPQRISTSPWI